jgi:iron complex outermembrane receptor protein
LFGSTSFGGGVNVLTSPLAIDPGIHLEVGYGSFTDSDYELPLRTYRVAFASGPVRGGKAALYARYSRQNSEGYRKASAADLESFAISGLHAGTYGNHKLDVLIGRERTQFAWEGISPQFGFDLDDREDRRFNVYSIYDNNVDDFRQVISSLTSEFPINEKISITNTTYYVDGEGFFEQFKDGRKLEDYGFENLVLPDTTIKKTDLVQRRWLVNNYWGLLPQIIAPVAEGRLTVGLGVRRYVADHFGEIVWTDVDLPGAPLDRYYSYDTEKLSFEAYSQIQYPILRNTILTGALQYQGHRYDWIQRKMGSFKGYSFQVDHDFLNPRFGLKHALTPELDLYGSVSYAQREPAESDYVDGDDPGSEPAFKRTEGQTQDLNDPIVEPEKVIDYELGASYRQPRWSVGLGLYWLDFRDELIPIDGGRIREEGQLQRANTEKTSHQGVELEATVSPIDGLRLDGNLSIARHRFVDHEISAYWVDTPDGLLRLDDNTIPRSPEVLGNLIGSYTRGPATFGAQLRHVGKQYVDGENTKSLAIDPFTLLDLSMEFDVGRQLRLSTPVTVAARVNNVFDTLYETFGYSYYDWLDGAETPSPVAFYWPGPTRSFFLSIGTTL